MTLFAKILALLTPKEKKRGALVMVMVIIMACLETAGVASLMPFLSVLGNPEVVQTNPVLATVYDTFGFQSVDSFLLALGIAAFTLIVFSAAFRTITYYAMNRFIEMRRHSISKKLLETYLRQPYEFFLDRHSGDMAKSILSEVDQLVQNVFRPGMKMVAYGVVALALIILLIAVDPLISAGVAVVIGGTYGLIFLAVRGLLGRVGRRRREANRERFEAAGEALGGIKDIKLLGREHAYLKRFETPSTLQASAQATNQTLAQVPKFAIEAVAFGGMIVLSVALMVSHGGAGSDGLGNVLPILGLYAFAGYKMLPAAQHVYTGMAKLRFGRAAVDGIHHDLVNRSNLAELHKKFSQALQPKNSIELRKLSYSYPNQEKYALHNINLTIPVGSSLGIIGPSGSGKTTLVDVVLGLLEPTHGEIVVDGEPLNGNSLRAWQNALGYVPQDIFLTDSTVAENIALGVPPDQVDMAQVQRCSQMAQLDDFISSEMIDGYNTVVGERGVRLSGGQRQRIGVARALYHDPAVLVFDEATSALDNETEAALMEAVETLSKQKTVIMIAHRLSTIEKCDQILTLSQGGLKNKRALVNE
ncbi:ABC transporter ATP-binding protein [Aquisalimonas sp. APHAB1-3]|uniref:ABC transporter ATP-binding protein n=1 Tax=Aquisalimonas sp. APHAB1-3 TaxID=3402080 RepID=UPI003AACDEFE